MAAQGVTPLHRKVRTSGTERMYATLTSSLGTGELERVGVVKTAKLCAEQDQIGEHLSAASAKLSGKIA